MTTKSLLNTDSDIIGAFASAFCLIHCIATPFIFIAQTSSAHHHDAPLWWSAIDIIFIVISFLAVRWSVKYTSKTWIKIAFWLVWVALTAVVLNEKLEILHLAESVIYVPALSLIGLHLYNKNHHHCEDNKC